jgi:hypothetical protein
MSNPYGSFAQGQYNEADIMSEMRRSGWSGPGVGGGYARPPATSMPSQMHAQNSFEMGQNPFFGSAAAGQNPFAMGSHQAAQTLPPDASAGQSFGKNAQEYSSGADPYGIYNSHVSTAVSSGGNMQFADLAEMSSLYDGAVETRMLDQKVLGERLLEVRNQIVNTVKPVYTFEKIVEVPQVIVKESVREVPKPQVVQRIIEVPKTEIVERTVVGPPTVQLQEEIVEVPQVVVEEREVHVPKREVRERLIEVPKVEFVEKIEYEDFIEYREVPVDKIVEVPEIEYRVKTVEHFVPQTYIQEYYVDKYVETPITQVQEVERIEHVPVHAPKMVTLSFDVPAEMAQEYQQVMSAAGSQHAVFRTQVTNAYSSYDPNKINSIGAQGHSAESHHLDTKMASVDYSAGPPSTGMPIGSQFLVPHGSMGPNPFTSMQGSATPPMAPPSSAQVSNNPFVQRGYSGGSSVPVF